MPPMLQDACARLEASAGPSVGPAGIGLLDGDTAVSHHSFKAALHAAGAVIDAVRISVTHRRELRVTSDTISIGARQKIVSVCMAQSALVCLPAMSS